MSTPSRLLKRTRRVTRAMLNNLRLIFSRRILKMPVDQVTNEYGFSMDPAGWNYFRALAVQFSGNPELCLTDSIFYQFFQHPRVREARTLNDVLYLHDPHKAREGRMFYLGTYPWGHWSRRSSAAGGRPFGLLYDAEQGADTRDLWGYRRNPWYEPGDLHPLEIEWDQTIGLFLSLSERYRPFWNGSLPEVTLLRRADGETRAVRFNGQHRLAILSALGNEEINVAISPESWGTIREEDVDRWYYVARGDCSREQALEIFHAFFNLNGRERIQALGLDPIY